MRRTSASPRVSDARFARNRSTQASAPAPAIPRSRSAPVVDRNGFVRNGSAAAGHQPLPIPSPGTLGVARVRQILSRATRLQLLVFGDLMLDRFIWGTVRRISPEAPVPVVEFGHESHMPGGAANVARNLSSLSVPVDLFGLVGRDQAAQQLKKLLESQNVRCAGVVGDTERPTSVKTRIIAHQQQLVRLDHEQISPVSSHMHRRLLGGVSKRSACLDAMIVGDYGKGAVSQSLLNELKDLSSRKGIWLSFDPKPVHNLDLAGLSLITPNRKEAFELAGFPDSSRRCDPLEDEALLTVADTLLSKLRPRILLITLGDQGMLLCEQAKSPVHIPTVAREVFDVSGAGDTVIASFTMAIAAGASPLEAAIISNHAAGIVVGKLGTATLTQAELLASFDVGSPETSVRGRP